MTHDDLGAAELLIAASHCSYPMIRAECLGLLVGKGELAWPLARNIPYLGRMIFPQRLAEEAEAAFTSSAFAAVEGAVAGLRFRELAGLLSDRSLPRQVYSHFRGRLDGVAGGVASAESPDPDDLMSIALSRLVDDDHRIIAADRASGMIGDPARDLEPGPYLPPREARKLVFLLSEDLPVSGTAAPAMMARAMQSLLGAIEMYALCGSFRLLQSFAFDPSVPEAARAKSVRMFEDAAMALARRATMQVDDEVMLDLLAASRSPWLGLEARFEAHEMLSARADMVAEVHFTGVVKESFRPPPPRESQTRLRSLQDTAASVAEPVPDGRLAAFSRLIDDMKGEKAPEPRRKNRSG
jgi:hypothetical protein